MIVRRSRVVRSDSCGEWIIACVMTSLFLLPAANVTSKLSFSSSSLPRRIVGGRMRVPPRVTNATHGNFVDVNQFTEEVTDPLDRWNIADRSNDEEMGAALDYLLEQMEQKPESCLHDLETDEAQYRERNEIAFDKFIDTLWYSPNLGLKKKIVKLWMWIDDWSKVEGVFQKSGSQITSEKILYTLARLREDVRHSRYHFDTELIDNLEVLEKRIQQTSSNSPDDSW